MHIRYQRRLQFASILKETPPSVITALSLIEYTAHSLMSKLSSVTLILQGGKHSFSLSSVWSLLNSLVPTYSSTVTLSSLTSGIVRLRATTLSPNRVLLSQTAYSYKLKHCRHSFSASYLPGSKCTSLRKAFQGRLASLSMSERCKHKSEEGAEKQLHD